MIKVIRERTTGKRTVCGTDWPVKDQIQRHQFAGRRPEWVVIKGLSGGVPDSCAVYKTKKDALDAFGE